jgi:hypothetical protein
MQHNFAAKFFRANARQLEGHLGNGVIGGTYEDEPRGQDIARKCGAGFPLAYGANCFARGGITSRYYRADFPTQLVQTPSQGAADASRTYDRQSTTHVMLG